MVSFNSLSIFIISDLKSLSKKSSWAFSCTVSIDYFLNEWMCHTVFGTCFACARILLLLKTGHCNIPSNYNINWHRVLVILWCATQEVRFSPFSMICCCFCLLLVRLVNYLILYSLHSLSWVAPKVSVNLMFSWWSEISLHAQNQNVKVHFHYSAKLFAPLHEPSHPIFTEPQGPQELRA